jgi:hypothetical protein
METLVVHDPLSEKKESGKLWCHWAIDKREVGSEAVYERLEGEGNLLLYGGASCLWECLKGNGTATTAQTLTYFSATETYIGIGDSSTAAAATQTDLVAASNKHREIVDSAPAHTDGTSSGSASCVYVATFEDGDAQYAWNEWGIFNRASSSGRMLNRKVFSGGTKAAGQVWTFTVTLTLA